MVLQEEMNKIPVFYWNDAEQLKNCDILEMEKLHLSDCQHAKVYPGNMLFGRTSATITHT